MTTPSPSTLESLPAHECWRLLRSVEVGRLAVISDGRPDIFPINIVVDHGTVVFRTAAGTKLSAAGKGESVAVEADGLDASTKQAWSVVIRGAAHEIKQLYALLDTHDLPLAPWHDAPKNRFVRVIPTEVSGRRFPVVDPARWRTEWAAAPHASME